MGKRIPSNQIPPLSISNTRGPISLPPLLPKTGSKPIFGLLFRKCRERDMTEIRLCLKVLFDILKEQASEGKENLIIIKMNSAKSQTNCVIYL